MPGAYRQRTRRALQALESDPRPASATPLRDLPDCYRLRLDEWRVIYHVDDATRTILVLRVAKKRGPETYQDLPATDL